MGVIRAVVSSDGVAGLWKGAMPGLVSDTTQISILIVWLI